MKLYQARMQIEEGFRDSKNHRYGLGVAKANRIGQQRRANLLLIAALAAFLLRCVGVAGKNQPIAKQVRVNSSSKREPYSLIFLARLLLRQPAFRYYQPNLAITHNVQSLYQELIVCLNFVGIAQGQTPILSFNVITVQKQTSTAALGRMVSMDLPRLNSFEYRLY